MKKLGITLAAIAGLLFTSSVASAQFCIVGVLAKAIYASAAEHRELTAREAMTCGLLKDEDEIKANAKKNKKKNKTARAAKKH